MALTKQKLLHKRSSVVGRILAPSALTYGEIAVNFSSGANNSFLEIKKYDDKPALYFEHPYATYSTTASGSTPGYFSANISGITEYYDGLTIKVRLGTTYDGSWNTLNVNGLGSKIIWRSYNGRMTSHFGQWSELHLTYRTSAGSFQATATARGLVSGTTYKDGWVVDSYYDSNDVYQLYEYYTRYYTGPERMNQYMLFGLDENEKTVPLVVSGGTGTTKPVNQRAFRPDKIYYYNQGSAAAANTVLPHGSIADAVQISGGIRYTFNGDGPAYRTIYLKGKLNESGMFVLSSGVTDFYRFVPYNQTALTLTDYFEEGWYYIRVGRTYSSANNYYLNENNPLFYFDGTNLIEISPLATRALSGGTALSAQTAVSAITSQSAITSNSAGTLYNSLHIYENGSKVASFNGSVTTSALTYDKKVYQSESTTDSYRPIILGKNYDGNVTGHGAAVTDQVYVSSKASIQPSTGKIFAGGFALTASSTNVLIGDGSSIAQSTLSPSVSITNSGSTNSAAQSVVYGAVTGGTKGHSVTLLRTNKIYSASTADKAISVEGTAGTADAYRNVWFSWSDAEAKRATDTQFQYNPAKNAIKVSAVTMNGTNIIQVPNKAGTFALTSDIDSALAGSVNYKGATSTVPASASTKVGDLWIAASAISLTATQSATGAAQNAEIGDFLIARANNKWDVVQKNIDGAVTAGSDLSANHVVLGNGNRTIKTSAYTIATSVPAGAVFTDTATTIGGHYTPSTIVSGTTTGARITGLTIDRKGHVTGISTAATDNVDTKVTSNTGTTKAYILAHTGTSINNTAQTHANAYVTAGKVYSNNSETVNLADAQTVTGVKFFPNGITLSSSTSFTADTYRGIPFSNSETFNRIQWTESNFAYNPTKHLLKVSGFSDGTTSILLPGSSGTLALEEDVERLDFMLAATANDLNERKQDKLVSGTNIKTVGGQSLLGSGDISISGITVNSANTLTHTLTMKQNSTTIGTWNGSDNKTVTFSDSATTYAGHYTPSNNSTATTTGARITGITKDGKGHIISIATAATDNTDTATTESGHYTPSTTASTLGSAGAGNFIKTITLDSKKHVLSITSGTALTSYTQSSVTAGTVGTGVVTGLTASGTANHAIVGLKTTAVQVNSAKTASAVTILTITNPDNSFRGIWWSHGTYNGMPVSEDAFQYNPATNQLKVSAITMNGTNAIQVPNKAGTFALTSDIDNALSSSVNYKGATSAIPASASTKVGDMYIASTSITLTAAQSATGAAQTAETGDFIIARANNKWDVIQKNLDGAVTTTATTLTDGNVIVGKGNRTIGVSSYTIAKSVPSNAVFTDSATTETGHYTPSTTSTTLGSTAAGNFIKTISLDSKKHVVSITSGSETQLSYVSGTSVGTAAASVVTGITVSNHAITYGKTNKVYSASTADSARTVVSTFKVSSAITATNLQHQLHIYQNGTRIATYSGGTIVSAKTTDEMIKTATATTKAYIVGKAAVGDTSSGITHANAYMSGGALYSEGAKVSTTDTKVTDANSSGKTFLLGHSAQGTNATAQTYTNVYMSAGTIAATEYKIEEKAVMKYNTTNQCIDFVFI